jgi:hypothetical protein
MIEDGSEDAQAGDIVSNEAMKQRVAQWQQ